MQETHEPVEFVERVAAIDIGKSGLVVCLRVPSEDKPGRRRQEVREFSTLTASLLALADWLRCQSVTLVAMEATSDYWKPVYYLLEAEGFTCWLLNAKHVKNVPGRPKTDKLDAVWLAKVVERGMCRPSLVHPQPIRHLRDLTRYRRSLVRERTREKQRVEKLLEDAQIKLSAVISDVFGVSGREMLRSPDRRTARPQNARPDGTRPDALQDSDPAGGAHRALHRRARLPLPADDRPHRRPVRPDRDRLPPDRRQDRTLCGRGRPAR
ncbi:IS110 family transposase [Nonomuraea sp. NPDC048916]|uniref:IS110 family transposase n=1 Tax=Nonomuraea sp. NPDC048916 TaxID=3154232 RepID=UPI0033DE2B69